MIPAWGAYAGERLQAAIASVMEQGRACRILVVDNAAQRRLALPAGVELVRAPRRLTLGAARNLGLSHVSTPWVIFWDADDRMLPGALALLEQALEDDPGLVAFGAAIIESPSGRRHRWPRRWIATLVHRPALLAVINAVWSVFPTTGATLILSEAARAAGGFCDADSGEDWGLGVALAAAGRLGWSEQPGRLYTQHEDSIWTTHSGPRDQLAHAALVRERLRRPGVAPPWLRAAVPLIGVAQHAALGAHVLLAALRRLSARRRA